MHPSCQNMCRFVTSAVEAFFRAITVLPEQPLMAWCIPVLNSNNWARHMPNLPSAAPDTTESCIRLLSTLQMFLHDHLSKHSVWSGA
ncbi:hypothetical protein T4B_9881, partial [Trichinella pseudospiralis]